MAFGVLWIVLIAFIIVGLLLLKTDHNLRKVKIVLVILFFFLLYLSIVNVFSSNDVDISNPKGVAHGIYTYFGWIGNVVGNLWDVGVETTGKVVNAVKVNESKGS